MEHNVKLYPWFQACRSLLFWQAVWFLYFQDVLSAAEAIMLAAVYDIGTTVLEVPSGYMSDRIGRRVTLLLAVAASCLGCVVLGLADSFAAFAVAQVLLGAGTAFASGTDHALIYDSLKATGREAEVAHHEARAWRFSFAGLAVSAFIGGVLAMADMRLAFLATAAGAGAALWLAAMFREPVHAGAGGAAQAPLQQGRAILERLRHPVLMWLFALTVGMYVFSHVPFVFGQPFIKSALAGFGLAGDAPVVSGVVIAAMMLVSVAAGWATLPLARAFGARAMFMVALAMQVALVAVLAWSVHAAAIALLLLRMVPDALARPLILARVQPMLESGYRATYLSLQSLTGRVLLAVSLMAAATLVPGDGELERAALGTVLPWYVAAGVVLLAGLVVTGRVLRGADHC